MSKVVIITGASRGIGAAVAHAAARDNWQVVVNYRNSAQAAQAVVDRIRAEGGQAEAIRGNVADADDVQALFARSLDRFGRLDGW